MYATKKLGAYMGIFFFWENLKKKGKGARLKTCGIKVFFFFYIDKRAVECYNKTNSLKRKNIYVFNEIFCGDYGILYP